jgi:PST family polysaccharide transporter
MDAKLPHYIINDMRTLVKTTFIITITEVLLMLVAVIRNKYLAMSIGAEGFGIYGLLLSFFDFAAVFSGMWLATGATKYAAEYNKQNDLQSVRNICSFSIGLTAMISGAMAILFIVAQGPVRKVFLSKEVLLTHFLLFSLAFIGMSLRPVFVALLQGLMKVRSVVFARIAISLVEIGLVVALVYVFELTGFFLSIFISSVFAVILLASQLYKVVGKGFLIPQFKQQVSRKLLNFGGVNLFLAFVNLGSLYLLRLIVVKYMDVESVGLLQAAIGITGYLGLTYRGSVFYFYPKMSENLDALNRVTEIDKYLQLLLMMTIPIYTAVILFGNYLVAMLLSNDFLPLVAYLPLFVISSFFVSVGSAFQTAVVGMTKLKIHTVSTLITHCLWIAFPLLMIEKYGIGSLAAGFIAGNSAGLLVNFVFLKGNISLILTTRTKLLLSVAVMGLTGAICLQNVSLSLQVIWLAVIVVLNIAMIKPSEWTQLYHLIIHR